MSPTGQSRRFDGQPATSALPLIADVGRKDRHVSKVPTADIRMKEAPTEAVLLQRYECHHCASPHKDGHEKDGKLFRSPLSEYCFRIGKTGVPDFVKTGIPHSVGHAPISPSSRQEGCQKHYDQCALGDCN